jgi:hypothetical protein
MRQLYVCTNAFSCKNIFPDVTEENELRPRLIGVLRELRRGLSPTWHGKYEFEYTIGGEFKEPCLWLSGLHDPNKIYNNKEIAHLLYTWLPPKPYSGERKMWCEDMKEVLQDAGMSKYNEWEWLKHFNAIGPQEYAYLYETLPKGIIRYDKN